MAFFIVLGIVFAVALVLRMSREVQLPETFPVIVGVVVLVLAAVWWYFIRSR